MTNRNHATQATQQDDFIQPVLTDADLEEIRQDWHCFFQSSTQGGAGVCIREIERRVLSRLRSLFEAADKVMHAEAARGDRLASALRGMLQLDEENHQRYAGDGDVCKEVRDARAALASAPMACDHKFYYFGDQVKERRCNRCNVLESKASAPVAGEAQPVADCWSNDDGDSWFDSPADVELTYGLRVGDEYELQASIRSWTERFRVTKAPDEIFDDYEVEPVSLHATPQVSANARKLPHIKQPLTLEQIEAEYASHDYSAELLLQHALLLLRQPQASAKKPADIDVLGILSEYGDHNIEHGRISFDKWTLTEAGEALLQRAALDAHKEQS
jgi:hypothetical protein